LSAHHAQAVDDPMPFAVAFYDNDGHIMLQWEFDT